MPTLSDWRKTFTFDKMKKIGILGCGWLGKQLAKKLLSLGYQVVGSTSKPENISELEDIGIETVLWNQPAFEELPTEFIDCSLAIVAFPPKVYQENSVVVNNWLAQMPKLEQVILMSSTGIYSDKSGIITENSPISEGILADLEKAVEQSNVPTKTILRLAGLVGEDREIAQYFHANPEKYVGNEPMNLITGDEVVSFTSQFISNELSGTYNLCTQHPLRIDFYKAYCQKYDLKMGEMTMVDNPTIRLIESNYDINQKMPN